MNSLSEHIPRRKDHLMHKGSSRPTQQSRNHSREDRNDRDNFEPRNWHGRWTRPPSNRGRSDRWGSGYKRRDNPEQMDRSRSRDREVDRRPEGERASASQPQKYFSLKGFKERLEMGSSKTTHPEKNSVNPITEEIASFRTAQTATRKPPAPPPYTQQSPSKSKPTGAANSTKVTKPVPSKTPKVLEKSSVWEHKTTSRSPHRPGTPKSRQATAMTPKIVEVPGDADSNEHDKPTTFQLTPLIAKKTLQNKDLHPANSRPALTKLSGLKSPAHSPGDIADAKPRRDIRLALGNASSETYDGVLRHHDVVLVPNMYGSEFNMTYYSDLMEQMLAKANEELRKEFILVENPTGAKAVNRISDRICSYFGIEKVTATVTMTWRKGNVGGSPHFVQDKYAFDAHLARQQNITVLASFGAPAEVTFLQASHSATDSDEAAVGVCVPQANNAVVSFGRDVNSSWKHGVYDSDDSCRSGRDTITVTVRGQAIEVK